MKQLGVKILKGRLRVVTGLHIGGGTDALEIGGMDNPIIRQPLSNEPYVPGSSLKGKMRSLSEWHFGRLHKDGKTHVCADGDCPVCRVFGATEENPERGPTRLIVRDAALAPEWRKRFTDGDPIVEEKHENAINRLTAVANPRPLERVVPGVEFDLELAYRVLDTGDGGATDERFFREVVLRALRLVEDDCLGGHGSRGSGRVKFVDLVDEKGNPVSLPEA